MIELQLCMNDYCYQYFINEDSKYLETWEKKFQLNKMKVVPMETLGDDDQWTKSLVLHFYDTEPYRATKEEEEHMNSILSKIQIEMNLSKTKLVDCIYVSKSLKNSVKLREISLVLKIFIV